MITIEDFKKVEMKIGKILTAEKVEGTDKLLKLEVDFGSEKRQILTAMAHFFSPEHFIGKSVPFIVNLEPRKIKGLESQGMILAADGPDGKPVLLMPEKEIPPGSQVG
jgi:methionine--tRNA ligase beta chain